jgi:hypothetical protein
MQQLQHRPLESSQTPFLFVRQLTLPWKQCITPELLQDLQSYIHLLPESTRKNDQFNTTTQYVLRATASLQRHHETANTPPQEAN